MSHYDEERNLPEGEQLQEEKLVVEHLYNKHVKDKNGEKLGPIDDIFLDDVHGLPEWVSVNTGFLGTKTVFLPVSAMENLTEAEAVVPWEKEIILDSPRIKVRDGFLSKEQEEELFKYYNITYVETPDGEEVLDEELVAAEEAGEVNAPGSDFESHGDETPNFAGLQEHMSEERRENLMENRGEAKQNLPADGENNAAIAEESPKGDGEGATMAEERTLTEAEDRDLKGDMAVDVDEDRERGTYVARHAAAENFPGDGEPLDPWEENYTPRHAERQAE